MLASHIGRRRFANSIIFRDEHGKMIEPKRGDSPSLALRNDRFMNTFEVVLGISTALMW